LKWSYAIPHGQVDSESAPAVANGIVYIGANDHHLYALDSATGTLRWKFAAGARILGSPAVANGVVYIASWNKQLYALNAATGARRWTAEIGNSFSSPAVANGIVYIGSDDRERLRLQGFRRRGGLDAQDRRRGVVVAVGLEGHGVMSGRPPARSTRSMR
jgi:outer membrane protein assembly factor BamB